MAQLEKIKLTAQTWDSDKDIAGFQTWLDTFSALLRSTTHGAALEDFICYKTGREVFTSSNVPSFLRDAPDFYIDKNVDTTPVVVATSVDPSVTNTTSVSTGVPPSAAVLKGDPLPTTSLEVRKARARAAAIAPGRQLFSDPDATPSLTGGYSRRLLYVTLSSLRSHVNWMGYCTMSSGWLSRDQRAKIFLVFSSLHMCRQYVCWWSI